MNNSKRASRVRLSALGVFVALGALATFATAGETVEFEVYISDNFAAGVIGAARRSSDRTQSIGCAVSTGGSSYGSCYAVSRDGTAKYCYTYNDSHLHAMEGINPVSYVQFTVNSDQTCGQVYVNNSSRFAP